MIRGNGLTKTFEGKTALDAVNFEIEDGSIYGLVGSNGSGKSTLLRLISGVYMPDGGKITVDGAEVFNNPIIKSQIAFLGDTPYFFPQSSINDMARFYSGMYPSFDYGIYKHLVEVFPLDYKARISTMSKGMAIVVVGGLLYSTLMTLFIVPIMYDILFKRKPTVIDVGDDLDDEMDDAKEYMLSLEQEKTSKEK